MSGISGMTHRRNVPELSGREAVRARDDVRHTHRVAVEDLDAAVVQELARVEPGGMEVSLM